MMHPISIRMAEETDLDRLCGLYIEFHEFHARHLPAYLRSLGKSSAKERKELRDRILKIIQGDDSSIVVADWSGRVIGLAEIYLRQPDLANQAVVPKLYAHLQSLLVTDDLKLQGIGNQLLHAAETWARDRGAVELRLDIWNFQPVLWSFTRNWATTPSGVG
jgi:GNAT superfamily N-acetyltransferase